MLSIIVITKNEAQHIARCLNSVAWADEIIVLDSGSNDDTVAICKQFTEHVIVTDWPGFGPQKQRALIQASHDWILSIDADEEVSPALKLEIQLAMQTNEFRGLKFLVCLVIVADKSNMEVGGRTMFLDYFAVMLVILVTILCMNVFLSMAPLTV